MPTPRYFALIPAAGVGARMGASYPKQYLPIAGKPMLLQVLETFVASPLITHCFVVVGADDGYIDEMLASAPQLHGRVTVTVLRIGGATRHMSVLNGLQAMREHVQDHDRVLVHDAARPGLTVGLIARLIDAVGEDEVGGLLAMPVVDTLKRGERGEDDDSVRVRQTVPRACLWAAQTPQLFPYALLRRALVQAVDVTDEASAIEAMGLSPKLVVGSARNFKITLPQDVALAELLLKGLS